MVRSAGQKERRHCLRRQRQTPQTAHHLEHRGQGVGLGNVAFGTLRAHSAYGVQEAAEDPAWRCVPSCRQRDVGVVGPERATRPTVMLLDARTQSWGTRRLTVLKQLQSGRLALTSARLVILVVGGEIGAELASRKASKPKGSVGQRDDHPDQARKPLNYWPVPSKPQNSAMGSSMRPLAVAKSAVCRKVRLQCRFRGHSGLTRSLSEPKRTNNRRQPRSLKIRRVHEYMHRSRVEGLRLPHLNLV